MRSTGAPIKRRQEQEMERETGSARPQGPRRYHHCQPLCVHSGACLEITSKPLTSLPFLPHFVFVQAQAVLKPTSGLLCVSPLGAGCLKTPQHPHVCVFSSGWIKSQKAWFCNPPPQHCTLTSSSVCMFVSECVRFLKHTPLTIYSNLLSALCLCVCCNAVKSCFAVLCVAIKKKKREREREFLSAFLCFTASLHCCCAALCSFALPRLPSALCVLLICPSVHCKAAVHHCVSVLCATVRLQSQILCRALFSCSLLLCLSVTESQSVFLLMC